MELRDDSHVLYATEFVFAAWQHAHAELQQSATIEHYSSANLEPYLQAL
jgi:hypothetical protein